MMKREHSVLFNSPLSVILLTLVLPVSAFAAEPSQMRATPSQADAASANEGSLRPSTSDADEAGTLPERIDVQSMKRRYWTVGNEDLMDVVQNRRYTKKGRVETALKYGFFSDDAFQKQRSVGLSLGYHLNEFFSVHGFYSSVSASNNQAYKAAGDATASASGGTIRINPDVNPSSSVMGAEARASLIYGKLSFLGKKIIYYDLNLAGGLSQHTAKVGSSIGYFAGLGQQFFINKTVFVSLDYRMLFHTDKFPSSQNPALDRTRSVTTNWIQVGVGAFLF